MTDSFIGKVVLVTGATSGIGRITAEKLAEKGAIVLVHGRSNEKVDSAIEEIAKKVEDANLHGLVANLESFEEITSLVKQVSEKFDRIDVLINNAGLGPNREAIFEVNYYATVLLCELLLPLIKKSKGRIINISSEAQSQFEVDSFGGSSGMEAYAQSKLAVVLYSFHLARRLKDDHVNDFALDPGSLLNTNMVRETFGPSQRSPEIGANAHIKLAGSEEVENLTGEFFTEMNKSKANPFAYDSDAQEKLWNKTRERLAKYL